jgi:uncharacterized protein (TIGR02246 family)
MTVILGMLMLLMVQSTSAADDLAQIEQRLIKTWLAGDHEAYSSLLADDWTTTDIAGRVLTKAEVMKEQFGPPVPGRPANAGIDDVKVRLLGETVAIVTGRTTVTLKDGSTIALRFTDVFQRRDGRWQTVVSQGTRIAQQP